jgi:hypothetical protein
LTAAIAEQVR